MTEERWLPVLGWEGFYEVSDQGRVKSLDRVIITKRGVRKKRRGMILHATVGGYGYLMVGLGRATKRTVHSLVMEAFCGPCPPGQEVRHYPDPNRLNVALTNLRYGTRSANIQDAVEHGTHHFANITHCPAGHEYTPKNTRVYKGRRFCRKCDNARPSRAQAMRLHRA